MMKMQSYRWLGIVALVVLGASARADDQPGMPPKPGPEFDVFKRMEGDWNATIKMPGGPESKGTARYHFELGGLWLASDFKGDFGGMPFLGRGMDTYDANKKKYVGVWLDSMSTHPLVTEGTYDADKKTMTAYGEGPGMDGKMTKMKMVTVEKDPDTAVFTMYTVGKDGQETEMMSITYNRQQGGEKKTGRRTDQ
jgi:hypothetical protein